MHPIIAEQLVKDTNRERLARAAAARFARESRKDRWAARASKRRSNMYAISPLLVLARGGSGSGGRGVSLFRMNGGCP